VGTIHSPAALRQALRLRPGAVDLFELRVDNFAAEPSGLSGLRRAVERLQLPLILTVRHPAEGGAASLSTAQRLALYREFLPHAALVDLELRSLSSLTPLLEEIRQAGALLIVSDHHFRRTPSAAVLARRVAAARRARPDVIKLAAKTTTPSEVARLLELLPGPRGSFMSVMGMGPLGKASRLLFARAGSVLNYGYLGEPQVPGQWPASTLRQRLDEVLADS
jgi:3-dehydroquinate dehydratase-1